MQKLHPQGILAEIPLSQLLMSLWQTKSSGYLSVKKHTEEKKIGFNRGVIVVERESFDEEAILTSLVEKEILDPSGLKRCVEYAKLNKTSFIAALINLRGFSPSRLWELLEDSIKEDIFPLFDWAFGDYAFDSEHSPRPSSVLFSLQPPDFVLQGIRQMKNDKLIKAHIPSDTESVQKHALEYWDQVNLEPPEEYLLNIAAHSKDLMSLCASSELGKKETQKIISALLSLGILSPAQSKTPKGVIHGFSSAELEYMWDQMDSQIHLKIRYSITRGRGGRVVKCGFSYMDKTFEIQEPQYHAHRLAEKILLLLEDGVVRAKDIQI